MENIAHKITEIARTKFGITAVKPYQMLVMHRILEQEESDIVTNQIVILPTGTGKSLCFLLPASALNTITVIIYPLLALMNDQLQKLRSNGIDCVCLRGGQTKKERSKIFEKISSGTKIIITNPETLKQNNILKQLSTFKIGLLVVDEAHVIAQWGTSFRPAYMELTNIVKVLSPHQTLAFTATASEDTVELIKNCLFGQSKDNVNVVRGDADRENIAYYAYPSYCIKQSVKEVLSFCQRPALVFCNKRLDTYKLCMTMMRFFPDKEMRFYHAGLSKKERNDIEEWFLHSNDGILFSTCAYGMGVDKPNIRSVIHAYIPSSAEEYLQESGRAGRDKQEAVSFVIIEPSSKGIVADIFRGSECRRSALLKALGQDKDTCSGCDVCYCKIKKKVYGEQTVRQLITRFPLRYSAMSAAKLLTGSTDFRTVSVPDRINEFFGVLDYDVNFLVETINAMGFSTFKSKKKGNLLYRNFFNKKRNSY